MPQTLSNELTSSAWLIFEYIALLVQFLPSTSVIISSTVSPKSGFKPPIARYLKAPPLSTLTILCPLIKVFPGKSESQLASHASAAKPRLSSFSSPLSTPSVNLLAKPLS